MTEVNRMRQENVDSAVELIQKRSVVQSLLELYKNNKKCRLFTGGCVVAWSITFLVLFICSFKYVSELQYCIRYHTVTRAVDDRLYNNGVPGTYYSASTRILFASLEIDSGLCIQNHTVRKIINCPRRLLILRVSFARNKNIRRFANAN